MHKPHTHDLNARRREIMQQQGCGWPEACRILALHAAAARRKRRPRYDPASAQRARDLADRISP